MSTDTNVSQLIINKMTQAQYDALTEKSPNELYFITDGSPILGHTISFKNSSNETVTFNGSASLDLTGGIYYATTAGTLTGLTATVTELNYVDGVTSNIQTQLDAKVTANTAITSATKTKITYDAKGLVTAGADLVATDIPDLTLAKITDVTASAEELNKLDGLATTSTELGYVNGVTSAIQTQIDSKVAKNTDITGATKTKITYDAKGLVTAGADLEASDIPELPLSKISSVTATAAELNILDGATLTTEELNYVDGVTSSIQDQLDAKQGTLTFDDTPTANSNNPVKSKGIKTYVDDKQDKLTSANAGTGISITRDATTGVVTIASIQTSAVWGNISGTLSNQSDLNTALNEKLAIANIINNVTTATTNQALSANMGKELQDQINNLKSIGRFLSNWNCTTGLPTTEPTTSPYTYHTGDYYYVSTVAGSSGTNYRPDGSSYTTGTASTVVETAAVAVGDIYLYDDTNWVLLQNTTKSVAFSQITGQPSDNTNLASALNTKVTANNAIDANTHTKITYDSKGLVTGGSNLLPGDIPDISDTYVPVARTVNNKALSADITLSASDVSALPSTTKYGADLSLSSHSLQLKDQDGNALGTAVTLPDTVYTAGDGLSLSSNEFSANVGSGVKIDTESKKIVADTDVVQAKLTTTQMNAVDSGIDSTKVGSYDTHIANTDIHVTATDKTTWNAKQNALSAGTNITIVNNTISTTAAIVTFRQW